MISDVGTFRRGELSEFLLFILNESPVLFIDSALRKNKKEAYIVCSEKTAAASAFIRIDIDKRGEKKTSALVLGSRLKKKKIKNCLWFRLKAPVESDWDGEKKQFIQCDA